MRYRSKKTETLKNIKCNWDEFAKKDPLWSILPLPEKKGNRWNIQDLFITGEKEIKSIMAYVGTLGIKIGNEKALDFGCGVGRLTQALAAYFSECYGVDISSKMIALANQYNQHSKRCKYILNCTNDLKIFQDNTFDFIYSNIVFQHIPPFYTFGYIKEFLRIMKPKGLIIFQITTEELPMVSTKVSNFFNRILPMGLRRFYKRLKYGTWAIKNMYCIKKEDLNNFILSLEGRIIDIVEDTSSLPRYKGLRYCITK